MATNMRIGSLEVSCSHADEYPLNLPQNTTRLYPSTLREMKHRLDEDQSRLLVSDGGADVSLRDLGSNGEVLQKRNIHTTDVLLDMIGLKRVASTASLPTAIQPDPKSRFIYIYGLTSRSPLRITRRMLCTILTFHQVMPAYLDFISVFGQQAEADDVGFAAFREQVSLSPLHQSIRIPTMQRSGQNYQICYNLKGISRLPKTNDNGPWSSIRQTAIHHQFDAVTGNALWIVTKGRVDLQQRYKELTGKDGRPEDKAFNTPIECFRSSFSAHLMFCFWAVENWRWYIKHLEMVHHRETDMAVDGRRESGLNYQWFTPQNIQDLQALQDSTNEVIMVLESNIDMFSSLVKFYKSLANNAHFPLRTTCTEDVASFCEQVEDMSSELRLQIVRAQMLLKKSSDRKELVIQHLQSQTTERTERLNENLEKDAIMVRIITIVTLVYLPATFVSTVFSTDIIKYQDVASETGRYSSMAMKRWLEVAVPLTVLTLLFSWCGKKWAEQRRGFQQAGTWNLFGLFWSQRNSRPLLPVSEKEMRIS